MRAIMNHKKVQYGRADIRYMTGNEPGYEVDGVLLSGIQLPRDILQQAIETGVRILQDGFEPLEEEPGVIVFGNFKGNRPALTK